jgi:hypothetical protein
MGGRGECHLVMSNATFGLEEDRENEGRKWCFAPRLGGASVHEEVRPSVLVGTAAGS